MTTDLLTPSDYLTAIEELIQKSYEIIPVEINRILVSEWAEKNRVLPEGLSPYPGSYSFDVNPYMREIVDCLSESSPVHEVAVMKGTQVMATVGLGENWIGYVIDSAPAPMLYVSGDATMAETQMELRVDAMINSAGIAHKIASQHKRKTQRKSGDIKTRKEFPGGFLVAAGPNSGAKLRSMSFQDIYVDEIDSFPDSTGKEGDPIYLIRRRVDAFSETYKILWTSTPLFEHNSKILALYREGDQRRYFVPCKHCGHMQYLKWSQLKFKYLEDGRLDCKIGKDGKIKSSSVHYECEVCGGEWKNSDKDWFLPRGEWRPTAEPRRPGLRSYHVPGLLSPVGFRSWDDAVIDFLQIKHEGFPRLKYQNFVNTFLGETFEDRGESPKIETLLTRERTYHTNSLPENAKPLFVTIGADVQKDRIECEVVAWGKNAESWSINYYVFHGDTSVLESEAWEAMKTIIRRKHAGMKVILTGIDSGYHTDVVYSFCDQFEGGVHPVMGVEKLKNAYIKLFNVPGHFHARIDINTDLLKQEIYRYLSKGRYESGEYPRGYCHFPIEYSREHFNRLTAEKRIVEINQSGKEVYKWDAGKRRNEQLDCRVYALAMVYGYRLSIETELKVNQQIDEEYNLTWEDFWNYLSL